jgi:putative transposase
VLVPRPPRRDFEGALHHVTDRGNRKQAIFEDAVDYECFLYLVGRAVKRFKWRVQDYCLLPNHYHLVIRTPEGGLSRGMQLVNGRYAQWFNDGRRLSGHLFQGRFGSKLVESLAHRLELARYVPRNPVKAALCDDPGQWRWSAYGALLRNRAPRWLAHGETLELFGDPPSMEAERYAEYVRGDK